MILNIISGIFGFLMGMFVMWLINVDQDNPSAFPFYKEPQKKKGKK